MTVGPAPSRPRRPIAFAELPTWGPTEAHALLTGLARHCDPAISGRPYAAPWLERIADRVRDASTELHRQLERADWDRSCPSGGGKRFLDPEPGAESRVVQAVEALFTPKRIDADGFFTGYYEPIIAASRTRVPPFLTPLYRRPPDLVRTAPRSDLPGDGTFGRVTQDGAIVPYPVRASIEAGFLMGQGLELAFVADPADAFFAQIQGSARLRFADGTHQRIGYHGRNGHPYTALGRVMIDQGLLPTGGATMATIRAVLAEDAGRARRLMQSNESFVFFRERVDHDPALGAVAAAGVPLVPFRSLAVDRAEIAFGTPVFVETVVPGRGPIGSVMIAEDTGTAIVGPARGDIFMGTGEDAGALAGAMKAPGRLTVFEPRL